MSDTQKQALLNGKVIKPSGETETQNIIRLNEKIIGHGYVPDEDEDKIEKVECKTGIIMPNLTSLTTLIDHHPTQNSGIPNWVNIPTPSIPLSDVDSFSEQVKSKPRPYYLAGLTENLEGLLLSPLHPLKEKGAVGFFDYLNTLSPETFDQALSYLSALKLPLFLNPNPSSQISTEPALIEDTLSYLNKDSAPIHFINLEDSKSLPLIQQAKQNQLPVSCSISLSIFMSQENPSPWVEALKNQTIDCLLPPNPFTHDIPHNLILPLVMSILYAEHEIPLNILQDILSCNLLKILNLPNPPIEMGHSPKLTLIDLDQTQTVPEFKMPLIGFSTHLSH